MQSLVEGGADPNARNPAGETPLHTTIRNGGNAERPSAVEALLQLGADPCIKDAAGYIPYNTAREGGTVHGMLANAGGSDLGCEGSETVAAAAEPKSFMVDPVAGGQEMRVTERANVRAGPGTGHEILTTLDAGTGVRLTGKVRGTDWLRIEPPGSDGAAYIHGSLVEEATDHLKVVVWDRPTCFDDRTGTIRFRATGAGLCRFGRVGPVPVEITSTCDTRSSSCEWPCSDAACRRAWTHTPTGSMIEVRKQVEDLIAAKRGRAWSPGGDSAPGEAPRADQTQHVTSREESEAERPAAVEEQAPAAAQTETSPVSDGGDTRVQAVNTEPRCSEKRGDMPRDTACWWEFTQPSGCWFRGLAFEYTYDDRLHNRTEAAWSGGCEGGVATGEGRLAQTLRAESRSHMIATMSGHFVGGLRQGHWVEEHYPDEPGAYVFEGPYEDGRRHGRWLLRYGVRSEYAHLQCTHEGLMVRGKRHGEWSERCNDGRCGGSEYVDGEKVNSWGC